MCWWKKATTPSHYSHFYCSCLQVSSYVFIQLNSVQISWSGFWTSCWSTGKSFFFLYLQVNSCSGMYWQTVPWLIKRDLIRDCMFYALYQYLLGLVPCKQWITTTFRMLVKCMWTVISAEIFTFCKNSRIYSCCAFILSAFTTNSYCSVSRLKVYCWYVKCYFRGKQQISKCMSVQLAFVCENNDQLWCIKLQSAHIFLFMLNAFSKSVNFVQSHELGVSSLEWTRGGEQPRQFTGLM